MPCSLEGAGRLDSPPGVGKNRANPREECDELGAIRIDAWLQYGAGLLARLPRIRHSLGGMTWMF
ncbi:MAG: hypothetical protein ACRDSP_04975 [Pseudonocardiaceae bacterium]